MAHKRPTLQLQMRIESAYYASLKRIHVDPEKIRNFAENSGFPFLVYNSNNSPETPSRRNSFLSPYHKKQAFCLHANAKKFIRETGFSRVGFLTLTFRDNVSDNKEASRRFDSLNKHFIAQHFGSWMLVKERQHRGAWHFHLLVDCLRDIRTGFDFDAVLPDSGTRPDYRSVSPYLRGLWNLLRAKLPSYGFGRSELIPLKTSDEAVSRYVGKYISKHMGERKEEDKGVRLTSYSSNFSRYSPKFAWNTPGSKEWRKKLARFAELLECPDLDSLSLLLGSRWAFQFEAYIHQVDSLKPHEIARLKAFVVKIFDGQLVYSHTGEVIF